jgi:16S rRNA (cytidine1402-2'-O)-methyltransferase
MRQPTTGAGPYTETMRYSAENETGSRNTSGDPPNQATPTGPTKCEPIAEMLASKLSATHIDPGLHIVATPIGNLSDITLRAIAVLRTANVIACEDTRVTGKLKSEFGLTAQLIPYHEHNAERATPALIERLNSGETVALVSDAGTPLVSDPGYRLVNAALNSGIKVIPVPGASAPLAALSVSGLPTDRFMFEGFLPTKSAARRKALEQAAPVKATLVFFESTKRLAKSLTDMADLLGNRDAVIAREITKRFEEMTRGPLASLAMQFETAPPPKGEVTIVVGPPGESKAPSEVEIDGLLKEALIRLSVKDAASAVASSTGLPRRPLYQRALQLQSEDGVD